jgi:CrcB protein
MIKEFLLVGIGGFFGSVMRYAVYKIIYIYSESVFPWGTLSVNIARSLLLGIIFGLTERGNFLSSDTRLFLAVGICGGFTTFSTFTSDVYMLLVNKELLKFGVYALLSFALALLAFIVGRSIINSL